MSYPYFRRNGDSFYQVIEDGLITKVEPDSGGDFYQHVGITTEDEATVLSYHSIPESDWDDVTNDARKCARVGTRPSIPPPH